MPPSALARLVPALGLLLATCALAAGEEGDPLRLTEVCATASDGSRLARLVREQSVAILRAGYAEALAAEKGPFKVRVVAAVEPAELRLDTFPVHSTYQRSRTSEENLARWKRLRCFEALVSKARTEWVTEREGECPANDALKKSIDFLVLVEVQVNCKAGVRALVWPTPPFAYGPQAPQSDMLGGAHYDVWLGLRLKKGRPVIEEGCIPGWRGRSASDPILGTGRGQVASWCMPFYARQKNGTFAPWFYVKEPAKE